MGPPLPPLEPGRRPQPGTGCGRAVRGPAGAWATAASRCRAGPAASCCWAAQTPTAPSRTRTSWSWGPCAGPRPAGAGCGRATSTPPSCPLAAPRASGSSAAPTGPGTGAASRCWTPKQEPGRVPRWLAPRRCPGRSTHPRQLSGTVCTSSEGETREQSRSKTSSFTCSTQVPLGCCQRLETSTRQAAGLRSELIRDTQIPGPRLGCQLNWVDGGGLLLARAHPHPVTGNLDRDGSGMATPRVFSPSVAIALFIPRPRMQQREASARLWDRCFGEPQSRSLIRPCPIAATCTWSQPDTRGDPPSPRHGHVVVAVGTKLLVHGGLAGDVFYNDLFCIDTNDLTWVKIPASGDVPAGRASHASAVFRDHLYIFGGIGPAGTLNTTHKYHIGEQRWTLLQFDAPLPAGRLDHAMCVIPWRAGGSGGTAAGAAEEEAEGEPAAPAGGKADLLQGSRDEEGCGEDPATHLLFVFGGMDTQGEIFRDCLVTAIE